MDSTPQVLRVLAALANPACLQRFAEVAAAQSPAPPASPKIDRILMKAGLLSETGDGSVAANPQLFHQLLARLRPERPQPEGIQRFLANGRLMTYPRRPEERRLVFRVIAAEVFADVETLSEKKLNDALSPITDDVARLRRAMIDEGVLQREADGSAYRPTAPLTGL